MQAVAALPLAAACTGCGGDDGPVEPPPDTVAPAVQIVYPIDSIGEFGEAATNYDETGNGLIDVRAIWSDDRSGVDPTSVRIEVLGELVGGSSGGNLVGTWEHVELTKSGLTFEETIGALVSQGSPELVVSVADSAGNRGADTLKMHVRHGDLHQVMALDYEPGAPTGDLVVCEDDGRLYATRVFAILVFDAITLAPIGTFPRVLAEPPARMLCIPGDPILYSTVRVERFNRTTLKWDSEIPGTFRTDGIARSRLDPDIIWAGEWGIGVPTQVDRSISERIGDVGLPVSSSNQEFTIAVAVLEDDRKIYYSRAREGGLVVGDPATGEQLAHIDLDPFFPGMGLTDNIVVGNDDRYVYAAVDAADAGLAKIDTETDEVIRTVTSLGGLGIDVALHPAGGRAWLTTIDENPDFPSASLLVDVESMEVLEFFPRPVPEGVETRWVLAATFHPNGKLLYQARDDDIDVYLIR